MRVEATCAVALVIITGFYTCYARKQAKASIDAARAAQKSADAAKSAADTADATLKRSVAQFRQQVRPYVIIETTRINQIPAAGVIMAVESVIRNTGLTPALNVRVTHTFSFETKLPCPFRSTDFTRGSGLLNVGSGLARSVRVFGQRGLLKSEVEAIENHTMFLCYSAVFEYEDIFGEKHRTEACSYYSPPKTGVAVGEGDLFLYACPGRNSVR
jgi:hypothetical protein